MAYEVKPPHECELDIDDDAHVFLAGSIEMGTARDWQRDVVRRYANFERVVFFNPRRDDWDSSWAQTVDNPKFLEQVNWELEHILDVNVVFFYFDPETKAPVSMMELGFALGVDDTEFVIVCPPGFWRRGNIEIMANLCGEVVYDTLEEGYKVLDEIIATRAEVRMLRQRNDKRQ